VTLIAAGLTRDSVAHAIDELHANGLRPKTAHWLDEGAACDIPFVGDPRAALSALAGSIDGCDIVAQPIKYRARRLLVADMDSTMITVECIDELADYAGLKPEVAAITTRAMAGELDFAAALDARVALLGGMPVGTIDACRAERVHMMPGARTLIATMRARGVRTLLVSGGFTAFADPVAAELGFDAAIANRLEVRDGVLTGRVERPIVDAARKAFALREVAAAAGLSMDETLAVGDGANDLMMIEAAGLGVAYHAKPVLADAADARIVHGDLTALLWAQGISRSEWVV